MQLYYAETNYFGNFSKYTDNLGELAAYAPMPNVLTSNCTVCYKRLLCFHRLICVQRSISITADAVHFSAFVPDAAGTLYATIRDDRLLLVTRINSEEQNAAAADNM